ncbi:hypothetical protein GCM10027046_31050 [Uliginosibacterium flavum]
MTQVSAPKWTQDQSIAYECACELIGHLMAIKSEQIERELIATTPNQERIDALRLARSALHQEREALNVTDDAAVSRIRTAYGSEVRTYEAA